MSINPLIEILNNELYYITYLTMLSRTINIVLSVMLIPAILSLMAETGLIIYLCIYNDIQKNAGICGISIGTSGFLLIYYSVLLYLNLAAIRKITKSRKQPNVKKITRCCGITTIVMIIPILLFWALMIFIADSTCIIFCSWIIDVPIIYTVYHAIMLGLSIWSIVNIQKEKRRVSGDYELLVKPDHVNP